MNQILFKLSIALLVLACSCNCQYIFNNCTDISSYDICQQYKSCEWVKQPQLNFCYSACTLQNYQAQCTDNKLCKWVDQQPSKCVANPYSCPSFASSEICNLNYCTFTPQKCSAQPEKCPSFTTQEACGSTQCTWQDNTACTYNKQANQCSKLIGDDCIGPYCQKVQTCTSKPQQQLRKSLITDVDCSQFDIQTCETNAECQLTTTCAGVTAQNQGCAASVDQGTCQGGDSAQYCTWILGTCNSNADYCTKNCDKDYCKVDQEQNCKINPKSTTCSSYTKNECTNKANYQFCSIIPIVPAKCLPKEDTCSISLSQDTCEFQPGICFYKQVGYCSFVAEVKVPNSSIVLIYSLALFAFLQIIF